MDVPDQFVESIEDDDDLRAAVKKVFEALPSSVQEDLVRVVAFISACRYADTQLANYKEGGHTTSENEQAPEHVRYIIRLRRNLASEAARTYIVAHEFAHAVLRHPSFAVRINPVIQYQMLGTVVTQILEDQADLQVCMWGYKDDLLAFHNENPDARRPTFIDQLPNWNF